MLRWLARRTTLLVIVLALVLIPAVLTIVGQSEWAQRRLQEIVTRQLAEFFKREVAVGPVRGNPLLQLDIRGLAIAEGKRLADGAVVTADRVLIDYDLWSILRGRLAPAASIATVHVWGARIRAVRDRKGVLNLRDLMPPPRVTPLHRRFRGRVYLHDSALLYADYGSYVRRPPFIVRADRLQAQADLRRITSMNVGLTARVLDGLAGNIAGKIQADLEGPFLNIDAQVPDIDAARMFAYFANPKEGRVTGGRVDVSGSLYNVVINDKPVFDLALNATLRNVQGVVNELGPRPALLNGKLWVGGEMVRIKQLRAVYAGSPYQITGYASGLEDPTVDLHVTTPRARLDTLAASLPADAREDIAIPTATYGSVDASVVGPLSNPDLRLRLGIADAVTLRLRDLGTVQGRGVTLSADVVAATTEPSVRARLFARQLQAPQLNLELGEDPRLPSQIAVGPLDGFNASVQLCGGKPIGEATIRTPWARADELRLGRISTRLVLQDKYVRMENLRAEALGGVVTGEAALRLDQPQQGLRARGSAQGIDLARLREIPGAPSRFLRGSANLDFQAHLTEDRIVATTHFHAADIQTQEGAIGAVSGTVGLERDGELHGAGRISVADADLEEGRIDRAEALVRFRGDDLELLNAYARGPDGIFWARGDVGLERRTLDVRVRGAELAMRTISHLIGLEDIAGTGYLGGTVSGSFDDPAFRGRLTIFDPQLKEYAFTAIVADVMLSRNTLHATDFLASRGSTAVSGNLILTNLGSPPEQVGVRGRVEGEGVDVAEIAELVERDLPIAGLAEFTAAIGGSLAHPEARGTLRLANARYRDLIVARVEVPYVYADDRLTVGAAEATLLDAPVQAHGTVTLGDAPQVDLYLSAGDLRLEGLAPFWDGAIPIGGTVSIPQMWLRGPLGDLQGGGRIVATEINLGDEVIRDVDAKLSLSRGQFQLQETSFEAAGGRVIVSAAYNYANDPDTVAAQIELLQTDVPNLLYLALPIVSAVDERPDAARAQTRLALRSYGLRLRGVLEGTINLSGPVTSPIAVADLRGDKLVMDKRALPAFEGRGRVTATGLQDLAVTLREKDAVVTIDGNLAYEDTLNLNIEGSGISLAQLRPWIPLDIPYGGRLGFTVVASGATRAPDLMASVDIAEPSFAGVQFDVLSVPIATVREGQIDVDTLIVKRGEQEIVLDGQVPFSWNLPVTVNGVTERRPALIPTGQITLGGRIEKTPLGFFLPMVDEYLRTKAPPPVTPDQQPAYRYAAIKAEGTVDSAVTLTGTVEDPMVRGFLKLENGSVQPPAWRQALTGLAADVQFTGSGRDNLVEIRNVSAQLDQVRATLTGRTWLNFFRAQDFWRNRFDLDLALAAEAQPLPGGTKLTGLGGGLTFRTENGAQVLRPRDLAFTIGGGRVTLEGESRLTNFALKDLASNAWDLSLKMAPGKVKYANVLDAKVSGNLSLNTPPNLQRAMLQGKWEVTDGIVGLAAAGAGSEPMRALSSRFPSPILDLTLAMGKNLSMRGSGVTAPLQPNPTAARVTGTPQRPVVVGAIVSRRGTTSLPTSTLTLNELAINYVLEPVPGSREDPVPLRMRGFIKGSAETAVARPGDTPIRIRVDISGSLPDQVVINTRSEPPLTESQIYALLGGVPFAYLPGVGESENISQVLSEQFLATLATAFRLRIFQPIEQELARFLGLSQVNLTFAFDQPVSIQLGKYVIENLLVTFDRPLVEDAQRFDLRVSYELPGGLRISYHEDERDVGRIEIGYSLTF